MPTTSSKAGEDPENPAWTKERIQGAMRFGDLSPGLQAVLQPKRRGRQRAPTKMLTSIRLSPDVLQALRARGRGWQTLVDEALRQQFVKDPAGK